MIFVSDETPNLSSRGDSYIADRGRAVRLRPSRTYTKGFSVFLELQGLAGRYCEGIGLSGFSASQATEAIHHCLPSLTSPITIPTALPFAGVGALVTLMLFGMELSIYAFVAIIMLVGLVKKNGIMMVDFALEAEREEGKGPKDAIYEACLVRFRPIMMTTMAALMGTLPIAMGFGAGAESRRPLGLTVVGGLIFSQTLTLYVTPVFYLVLDRLRKRRTISPEMERGGLEEPISTPAVPEEEPAPAAALRFTTP